MFRPFLIAALVLTAAPARAEPDHFSIAAAAVQGHILPGFQDLARRTQTLAEIAPGTCDGGLRATQEAWVPAMEAWARVSHLRFGPSEEEGRAFAIQYWPDDKGAMQRSLRALIAAEDPVVDDPAEFATVSVAARGLMALEWLLFDENEPPPEGYRCRLVTAIARDLAATSATLLDRWRDPWSGYLMTAGAEDNPVYFTPEEATRQIFTALLAGLEMNADLRLGRPLGTFDRPRPTRAEAWRTRRSLPLILASLGSLRQLTTVAFYREFDLDTADRLDQLFDAVIEEAARQPEPLDMAVATPQGHIRIESLQSAVRRLRDALREAIAPALGISEGFNSMDGD